MLKLLPSILLVLCAHGVWAYTGVALEKGQDGCSFHTPGASPENMKLLGEQKREGEVKSGQDTWNLYFPKGKIYPTNITHITVQDELCDPKDDKIKPTMKYGGVGFRFVAIQFDISSPKRYKINAKVYGEA